MPGAWGSIPGLAHVATGKGLGSLQMPASHAANKEDWRRRGGRQRVGGGGEGKGEKERPFR